MQTDLLCVILRPGRRVRYNGERVTIEGRSSTNENDIFAARADGAIILAPWYRFDGLCYRSIGYAYKYDQVFRSRPRTRSAFRLARHHGAKVLLVVEGPCHA